MIPASDRLAATPTRARRRSVVVVDDSPDFRWLVRRAFHATHDFEVVAEAGDGLSALETVAELRPGLMLLDIEMPTMDGLQTLRALRTSFPETEVVVVTALTHPRTFAAAMSAGAVGVVRKGSSLRHLVRQVRAVLGGDEDPAGVVAG